MYWLHIFALWIKFPLTKKGRVEDWIWQHLALTWVIFAVTLKVSDEFGIACLAAASFFPVRAVVWKAPWAPGHDINDPFSDYGWGALVPVLSVAVIYWVFG